MPSVIPATLTQPALTKDGLMVGGQVGTRSLVLPMSPKGTGTNCFSTSLGDPHFS